MKTVSSFSSHLPLHCYNHFSFFLSFFFVIEAYLLFQGMQSRGGGAEQMAQLVKHLLYEHEGQSSNPHHQHRKLSAVAEAYNLIVERWRQEDPANSLAS